MEALNFPVPCLFPYHHENGKASDPRASIMEEGEYVHKKIKEDPFPLDE